MAAQLREALIKSKKLMRSPSLASWAAEFTKLLKDQNTSMVCAVLDWYCRNLDEEYTPQAYSATSFRLKFGQLQRAMQMDERVVLHNESDRILADRLRKTGPIPPEICGSMEAIIHRTVTNWTDFLVLLLDHKERVGDRSRRFIDHILQYRSVLPMQWMQLICDIYRNIDHYHHSPMKLAFRKESTRFHTSFWRKWSNDWCHDPRRFDDLYSKVKTLTVKNDN